VALHSFYYGLVTGLIVSTASSLIYLISYVDSGFPIHWTDFALRIFFMYMLSVSAGLLTGKMRRDREKIEILNRELEKSLCHLEKAQKKLVETTKLAALGRMTADVAHEIRNPLVSIGGFARRLNGALYPDAPEKRYARIIVEEVERLEKILRDLLLFSKSPVREFRVIEIPPLVEKSLEIFLDDLEKKEIRTVREYSDSLPVVSGDEQQLEQVFVNVIGNAVQAMSRGGVLTLRIRPASRDGRTMLSVGIQDTGPGIPDEIRERIFDPFFTTKEIGEGTGLGLSVSRRIVEEHQGKIEVESGEGEGSLFIIFLPGREEIRNGPEEKEVGVF